MALVVARRLRPRPGFIANGDGLAVRERDDDTLIMVVDGVGHGHHAAEATQAALDVFQRSGAVSLSTLLADCNAALAGTRGAALALVQLRRGATTLLHLGVGNVSAYLWTPTRVQTLLNRNGIVGRLARVPNALPYETVDRHLLLIHSDGLSSRTALRTMEAWDGDLEAQVDRLMAEATERDDACVLLAQVRHEPLPPPPTQDLSP